VACSTCWCCLYPVSVCVMGRREGGREGCFSSLLRFDLDLPTPPFLSPFLPPSFFSQSNHTTPPTIAHSAHAQHLTNRSNPPRLTKPQRLNDAETGASTIRVSPPSSLPSPRPLRIPRKAACDQLLKFTSLPTRRSGCSSCGRKCSKKTGGQMAKEEMRAASSQRGEARRRRDKEES